MKFQMFVNYSQNEAINQINTQSIINFNMIPELEKLEKINIIQEVEFIDWICPTCTQNKYSIIDPKTEEKLFDLKENSLYPERYFCFQCRVFLMKINNTGGNNYCYTYNGEKGCSLPCLCGNGCGQPSIKVTLTTPNNKFLGSVKMDYESCYFSICDHKIIIRDEKKNTRYQIQKNDRCIGAHNVCSKCCDILFHIYKGDQIEGEVKKLKCSSCYTFCPKGDYYTINFPQDASSVEKFLILIGVILLDYINFYI